jgi:hypothetical protein
MNPLLVNFKLNLFVCEFHCYSNTKTEEKIKNNKDYYNNNCSKRLIEYKNLFNLVEIIDIYMFKLNLPKELRQIVLAYFGFDFIYFKFIEKTLKTLEFFNSIPSGISLHMRILTSQYKVPFIRIPEKQIKISKSYGILSATDEEGKTLWLYTGKSKVI